MNRLARLFFIWLLFFFLITAALWLLPIPNLAAGSTDSTLKTLQHSGATVASSTNSKWLAGLYGLGIIGIFSFVLFLGARNTNLQRKRQLYSYLGIGTLLYFLVYLSMVYSWWSYTETNSFDYFLGVPQPTAWMLGLMMIPLFISSIYVLKFDDWIFNKEDQVKFDAILERRKKKT